MQNKIEDRRKGLKEMLHHEEQNVDYIQKFREQSIKVIQKAFLDMNFLKRKTDFYINLLEVE